MLDNNSAPRHIPLQQAEKYVNNILKTYTENKKEEAEMDDHKPSAAKNYECDDTDTVKADDDKEEHTRPTSIPGDVLIPLTTKNKESLQQSLFAQESASNTGPSNRMQELEDIEKALRGVAKARSKIDSYLQMSSTFIGNTHSASTCTATPCNSTSIRPRSSIPRTIVTLSEVSLTITEKAGQRLYKQAIERQKKLAQKQLEAIAKRKPKGVKTKKLERKKVKGRKSLPLQNYCDKVAANNKHHNAENASISTHSTKFSESSSESSQGTGQDDSVFAKDKTTHKSSSLNNRKQGKARLQPGKGSCATKVVSGKSKISPKRDLDLVGTTDVLSFYHAMHAQSHIQSLSMQCTSGNHRLLFLNKAVIKCLDQLTKMEMKKGNGHPGKLYRCRFTEAAEKWLLVGVERK
mmetsp:Transcript_6142/g.9307  ORF Transcript_6142/g.9307 Transcript_6142/m.9307 type:complete len:406 (+) Transcript_6142:175-1392(+)